MLDKLKLLHAYLGGLITEAAAGQVAVEDVQTDRADGVVTLYLAYERVSVPAGCDHEYRRIASGEYECRVPGCGAITDEPEGEQWS